MISVFAKTLAGDLYLREFPDGLNTVGRFLTDVRPDLNCSPYDSVEVIHPKSFSTDVTRDKVNRMRPENLMQEGVVYLIYIRPFRLVVDRVLQYLNNPHAIERNEEEDTQYNLPEIMELTTTYFPGILNKALPVSEQEAKYILHDEVDEAWKSFRQKGRLVLRSVHTDNSNLDKNVVEWLVEYQEYQRILSGYHKGMTDNLMSAFAR